MRIAYAPDVYPFADHYLVSRNCLSGDLAGSVLLTVNDRYAMVDRPQPS